jgi:hypothetical protein
MEQIEEFVREHLNPEYWVVEKKDYATLTFQEQLR